MKKNTSPRIVAIALLAALACGCLLTASGCTREAEQPDLKPVIYLYPEEKEDVSVELDYAGDLTCTYPEYNGKWNVTAQPDGTLTDADGQTYNYLYWEARTTSRTISPRVSVWRGATPRHSSKAPSTSWG